MIRSLWVGVNLVVSTLLLASSVVVAAPFGLGSRVGAWAGRSWSRWMLWATSASVEAHGLEHIRPDRPQVVAANHQSWYDVFALAVVIPKRYRFVAKMELAKIPIFGQSWRIAGHISIDRSNRTSAIRSLERAGELMRSDNSAVVVFPEGTRSLTGELQPFKKGGIMLALHNRVEIVPVAISGTYEILRKHGWRVRSGRIIVRVGPPVPTSRYDETSRDELVREVQHHVAELLDTPASTRTA